MPRSKPSPLRILDHTAVTAAGIGRDALRAALAEDRSALRPNDFIEAAPLDTWIGRVDAVDDVELPPALHAAWDCRNHRLAWMALQADGFAATVARARERHGASRIAVVMGTSTSTIGETEAAYHALARDGSTDGAFPASFVRPGLHTLNAIADFVAAALDVHGPAYTISTACSSSAKAFASAARLLNAGLCDAVVVGGADSLCGHVLHGFHALQLVSAAPCRPFDVTRDGISLGEAAGFALVERDDARHAGLPRLLGTGESSDAHHQSSPHPEGLGAELALDAALAMAGLAAHEVDYLNLHGTASARNDAVEAALLSRRFDARTHASATKGVTGHALGAAGIVEAVACLVAITHDLRPGTAGTTDADPAAGPALRLRAAPGRVRVAASHSFGFGGNNAVLVFGEGER